MKRDDRSLRAEGGPTGAGSGRGPTPDPSRVDKSGRGAAWAGTGRPPRAAPADAPAGLPDPHPPSAGSRSGTAAAQNLRGAGRPPEPLIFELSAPGRRAFSLPALDVPERDVAELVPDDLVRREPADLPEVAEVDVVRHFTRLSQLNHGVDTGFYPLGSCTMKYNPKINELVARLPGFAGLHPLTPEPLAQGALRLLWELERYLAEIGGVARVSLQPAAGAHGEFTGLQIIRAYHLDRGEDRRKVLVPDSAHGTNPATAAMCGCYVVTIPSDARGGVDVDALRRELDAGVAALMLTNPNTLGLWDERLHEIAGLVHEVGGLLYYDGANLNGSMGWARPGDTGFDVVHFNLHKTFSTPHGGGGPGAGPVGVKEPLVPFLPIPTVEQNPDGSFRLDWDRPKSIGKLMAFYGNFGNLVRAYTYIRAHGSDGLRQVCEDAVLNANYLLARLRGHYDLPYDRYCKHEFVLSARRQRQRTGVRALDIAKALLDYGYHPPTIYFPLIVEEALMIEPTETESVDTLDAFAEAMITIARLAEEDPERVKGAPYTTRVGRLDEARAARQPDLRWRAGGGAAADASGSGASGGGGAG